MIGMLETVRAFNQLPRFARGTRLGPYATALLIAAVLPLSAQTYRAPRAPGGKPDLNGIWQALNEANYHIEAHEARPAMALRPGPYGPVPAPAVLALGA